MKDGGGTNSLSQKPIKNQKWSSIMYIQMGNGKMFLSENCLGNKWKANVGIWLLLFVTPNEWIYLSTIYNFSFPQESDKWILWTFWWENTVVVLPMRSNWNPSKRLDLVVSLQGTQRIEESVELHEESTISKVQTGWWWGDWAGHTARVPLQMK